MEINGVIMDILERNRKYFPHEEIPGLYKYQSEALDLLMNGKNTLVIAPTGGGKSLIYYLAGLEIEGLVLVISPLRALMREQVDDLNTRGINSLSLSGDISFKKQRDVLRAFDKTDYKFLYVSPERLQNYFFRAALIHSKKKIGLVVIDEAHCISQWGFEFRPEYSEIKGFIDFLNSNGSNPEICALTGTISDRTINDIVTEFYIIEKPIIEKGKIIRPELHLNFIKIDDEKAHEDKWNNVIEFIKKHKARKSIIYFYSIPRCKEFSKKINEENPLENMVAASFHGDMDEQDKLDTYRKFKNGQINILCSTTAFGLGMNIPDIDCVIQYHLPKSIEEYYQQVGRGARDKNKCSECNCLLFWTDQNLKSNYNELERSRYNEDKIRKGYEHFELSGQLDKVHTISYSEYQNSKLNLAKLKIYFEKLGLIKLIGEINGGPLSIRVKK